MSERGGPPAATDGRHTLASDQEIMEALYNILREPNPNGVNLNGIVQQLQSKLGLDLSHKLDFIHAHTSHFWMQLQAQAHAQAQAQAQAQARAHIRPQQPQQQLLPHQNQQQQQHQDNLKDHVALLQHRNYHFPPNFTLHRPEEYNFRNPSQSLPPQAQPPQQPPPAPAQPVASAAGTPKASAQSGKKRRGGPGGLNKLCGVSPELQTIVGQPTMPRTEIVRQLWAYIRKNNLQDPNNKRKINCNDELRLVFEVDCTDMFKMNKLLSKHILPLDATQSSKKTKVDVESASESSDSVPIVVISEALAIFFGTEVREMSHAEVLRQVWEYVKVNQLEDPLNSMVIQCDPKLRELFGCESISALGIPEMLARRHLTNKS